MITLIATEWLTPEEIKIAEDVGALRQSESRRLGGTNLRFDQSRTDVEIHQEGAIGELAVAKYLGVEWDRSINAGKAPDVAGYQVRSTRYISGSLILRPNDLKPDEVYVLVIVRPPRCDIIGSIRCADGRRLGVEKPPGSNRTWVSQDLLEKRFIPLGKGDGT